MRVGIDITSIMYGRGVSRYTSNLVRSLDQRPEMELYLYGSSFRQQRSLEQEAARLVKRPSAQNVVIQRYPPSIQNLMWNVFSVNKVKNIFPKLQVFHSWDWLQPPDKDIPLVSTIHDLAILRFPETAHPKIMNMHQKSWEILKARNAHIIAVSRATRKDVIELLGFSPDHVHVVYEALPIEQKQAAASLNEEEYETIKNTLQLNKPFVLFVGTREPRKNLMRLIEAWEPMSNDIDLIIAGETGWDATSSAQKLLKNPNLRFLGRVKDKELVVLYGEAAVFAYPCLYEGFGLPILEAFHHGTPVVTSNISSMPEVAGNAAELIDPFSVESIREGLMTILNEPLPDQKKRLQRMIIRLQMFDWRKVAEETASIYRKAIADAT